VEQTMLQRQGTLRFEQLKERNTLEQVPQE
jgi:hypothetical protein